METNKSLNRDEINRNCERTLTLLRSNKPDAADLMLNMLNDSIFKRYGDSKQAIDVSRFSKLNSDNDIFDKKVPNKKPKLNKIKKEKSQLITKNVKNLNEQSSDVNIQELYHTTKHISNKLDNKMSKHYKFNNKIIKDENNLINKTKGIEKSNISAEKCDEETTLTTIKNLNKIKSNVISKQNENGENSNETEESKNYEIKNTEKSNSKGENELFGTSPTVRRKQLQQKPITKVRSHKKPPLHELSSRQRIQAVLEKGINNK